MTNSKQYVEKLRSFSNQTENDSLKNVCKIYAGILESKNYNDMSKVIEEFLTEALSIDMDEKENKKFVSEFKIFRLFDIGLSESYNNIIKNSKNLKDPVYKEKLKIAKDLIDNNEDYKIVEKVVNIFKKLPSNDNIMKEIEVIEEGLTQFQDDIRVLNMIEYLKDSKKSKQYPKTVKECASCLEDYLADPNAYSRFKCLECLRELNWDPKIKEFSEYLTTLNFADDTYNHSVPVPGSLSTGRVYSGGYLEKWNNGESKNGLGKIVIESIESAQEIAKDSNDRIALKLLVQNLSNKKLNKIERRVFESIKKDYSIYDLGIQEILNDIKESKSPVANTREFKSLLNLISESLSNGLPDYKIANQIYSELNKFSFDPVVSKSITTLEENYKESEELILIESIIEYIDNNPRLGVFNTLKNDLKEYKNNPTKMKKSMIVEKYSKLSFDSYFNNFLNQFSNTKTNILNSDPKEFKISKVNGLIESVGNKDYFFLNNRCLVKEGNNISVASKNEIPDRLAILQSLYEQLNFRVVNDWTIQGFLGKNKVDIVFEEDGSRKLNINDKLIESKSNDVIRYGIAQTADSKSVEALFDLYENLDNFVELDFIERIGYIKESKVYADVFTLGNTFYVNLVNENINMNKIVKTKKPSTLRNYLFEFMEFDISESIKDRLQIESSKVEELKKQANLKMKEIKTFENKIDKMLVLKKEKLNEEQQKLFNEILEELRNEILNKKEEYKKIIDDLSEAEDENNDESKDDKEKESKEESKEEKPKEEDKKEDKKDDKPPFEIGDTVRHKPSDRKGKVTACANKLTCTVKFEDNKIETVKIEDTVKTEETE